MKLIPAIDLMNGKCVRLVKGDFNESKEFSNNPVLQAKLWENAGASSIHIVDLDAAKTGKASNDNSIKEIAKAVKIPIQIGGGVRSEERINNLFSYGINKVIMGTSVIEDRKLVENLTRKFPNKIIIGIDSKDGKVSTRGWIKSSDKLAIDVIKDFSQFEISNFIVTDINTDGTLNGPNEKFIEEILLNTNKSVIASGGIGSISDLLSLIKFESKGLDGVIVGKALYENKFSIIEAINALSSKRLNDVLIKKDHFA
tara:strand:+ start:6062 stop:6829 length:768 start_codon:yes stop_codon:yes gene_type:complete